MNNLLDELKENSTILCNSLSDADIFKSFHTVQAPPKSQPPSFFNFSVLNNYNQSPRKSVDQVANSRGPSKTVNESPRIHSKRPENQSSRGRTSDKKRTNHFSFLSFDEISPKKPINVRGAIDKKDFHSQTDSFINYLNMFGSQVNDDPNCCSSEYQYSQPDQSTEDFLLHILNLKTDENDAQSISSQEIVKREVKRQYIKDMLQVSRETIDFGPQLPGRISEESFDIKNISNHTLSVEIIVSCANPELQDTQEYVYSIRSSYIYDYSERRQLSIAPNSTLNFKMAVKIPPTKFTNQILGNVRIISSGLEGELTTTLKAHSVLPKIYCPKQLYSTAMKRNFINVAINKGKPQEKKISLKNESNLPVTLELGFYNPQKEDSSLECSVYPKTLTIPANGTTAATILFKTSTDKNKADNDKRPIAQKILYGKAQDSSLIYSFTLRVETI